MAHQYSLNLSPENLKVSDRLLYETISSAYHVELGFAVNNIQTDCQGHFSRDAYNKSINIMDYACKSKFNKFADGDEPEVLDHVAHLFCGKAASFEQVMCSD
jgi:hypothetical protein